MEIVAVEQVAYRTGSDDEQADVIGFNFTYEDGSVYQLGPVLLPQELLAIMRMAVQMHAEGVDDGNNDTDTQE